MTASHGRAVARTDDADLRESAFLVYGQPAPQSGTRIVNTGAGPRGITTGGVGLEAWRSAVSAEAAVAQVRGQRHTGPVALYCDFRYLMPASRPSRVRRQEQVPRTVAPDLDKLLRAVCDSLKVGGLIFDDAQIAEIHATKTEWADSWTGADICIKDLWTP